VPFPISPAFAWSLPDIYFCLMGVYLCKPLARVYKTHHEKPHPFYQNLLFIAKSKFIRKTLALLVCWLLGNKRQMRLIRQLRKYKDEEVHNLHLQKEQLKHDFNKMMKEANVDLLISPVNVHCATKSIYVKELAGLSFYNFMANMIDVPCGVVPVTKVLEGEDTQAYEDGIND
jgi:hypothetical protein